MQLTHWHRPRPVCHLTFHIQMTVDKYDAGQRLNAVIAVIQDIGAKKSSCMSLSHDKRYHTSSESNTNHTSAVCPE